MSDAASSQKRRYEVLIWDADKRTGRPSGAFGVDLTRSGA